MEDSDFLRPYENEIEKYGAQVVELVKELTKFKYFEGCVVVVVVCLFFFLGRLSYNKRFTHLLQMVNDAEIKRQKLIAKLEKNNKMLAFVAKQKFLMYGLFIFLTLANLAYGYFSTHVNLYLIIFSVVLCIFAWLSYFLPLKYLKWKNN
jgi:hypothetical protein